MLKVEISKTFCDVLKVIALRLVNESQIPKRPPPKITVLLILKLGCSASQISHDLLIDLSRDYVSPTIWFFLRKVAILLELVAVS